MSASRELVFVDDEYYIHATSSRVDDRKRVLKQGDMFAVFDRLGDIHPYGHAGHGLYCCDTRFLSRFELAVGGSRPLLLNSGVTHDTAIFAVDLSNVELRDGEHLVAPSGDVHLFRGTLLWERGCFQQLRITNFGERHLRLPIVIEFGADFVDIFEVRGLERDKKGKLLPPEVSERAVVLGYEGLDGVRRRTRIACSLPPDTITNDEMSFEFELVPGAEITLCVTISCELDGQRPPVGLTFEDVERKNKRALADLAADECSIHTANDQFNDWINRSFADLRMLTTSTPNGLYPFAGVPWYSTIFGRDGLITALQTLWVNPRMARGVLDVLGALQADGIDPERDAEPGKIVHEVRNGEMAALKEVPFGLYYGTVDATPLFVMLAARYFDQTGDIEHLRELWPRIERALTWIDEHGDKDDDGFVEYLRQTSRGLANQGWKDSFDSVSHSDGVLATGAIAPCEVQGYVYDAKCRAAQLARTLGRRDDLAKRLEREAAELRKRFNEKFWCDDLGTYATALDGEKRACRIRTSNAGHVLYAGLAPPQRARRVAAQLMSKDSFTGWGIRTLSRGEARFNPMSYHNGSVWPHDTAIIGAGFARYGFRRQAVRLLQGLFDATMSLDERRLPELFCGFRRRYGQGPTRYPVACSPQAWASGSVFMLLQACLGISFHREKPQIRFTQPMLPKFLPWIRIENLRAGDAVVDLMLRRHPKDVSINVLRSEGDVSVAVHLEP